MAHISESVAVALLVNGWHVVRRRVNDSNGGSVDDDPIEGPFPSEGSADQRAREIALDIGAAERDRVNALKRATHEKWLAKVGTRKPSVKRRVKLKAVIMKVGME